MTTYSATGLTPGGLYYFEVRSYITGAGNSAPSNWAGTNGTTGSPEMAGSAHAEPNDLSTLSTVGWSATLGQSATVNVYVGNRDGTLTSDEYARIENAIATWNSSRATGLTLVEVFDPTQANIIVENSANSLIGGQAQGVLGDAEASYRNTGQVDNGVPYLQFSGQVVANMIEGWSWYTGSDPTAIETDQYDYQTVVVHELGHAVGLNYEDPSSYGSLNGDGHSVMYPAVGRGQVRRQYSSYDVSWLNHLYASGANPGPFHGDVVAADALQVGGLPHTDETSAGTGKTGARMLSPDAGVPGPPMNLPLTGGNIPSQQLVQNLPATVSGFVAFLGSPANEARMQGPAVNLPLTAGNIPSQQLAQNLPATASGFVAFLGSPVSGSVLSAATASPIATLSQESGSAAQSDRVDGEDGLAPPSLEAPSEPAPAAPDSGAPLPLEEGTPKQDHAPGRTPERVRPRRFFCFRWRGTIATTKDGPNEQVQFRHGATDRPSGNLFRAAANG